MREKRDEKRVYLEKLKRYEKELLSQLKKRSQNEGTLGRNR
jgi:hypothetical protein